MFYTGQKVVCVDDGDLIGAGGVAECGHFPIAGEIYTVARSYRIGCDILHPDRVELREIRVGPETIRCWGDVGFSAVRFRPLCEPKTSIEIFRKALVGDLIGEEA